MPTFGEVKIKQLPSAPSDKINDTDLLVIDKDDDTYSVTINALRSIFSADAKILGVQQELLARIDETQSTLSNAIEEIANKVNTENSNIQELIEYMEKSKKDILDMKNNIVDMNNAISTISDTVSELQDNLNITSEKAQANSTDIENLKQTSESITTDIENLKQTSESTTASITELESNFTKFSNNQNLVNTELVKRDGDLIKQAKEYSDEQYDDLMGYIDKYHHIYPVGTLYHTTDKDGDVKDLNNFGTWKLVGQVTLSTEDNIIEYIFERIK